VVALGREVVVKGGAEKALCDMVLFVTSCFREVRMTFVEDRLCFGRA
jgi:hypothetical protein